MSRRLLQPISHTQGHSLATWRPRCVHGGWRAVLETDAGTPRQASITDMIKAIGAESPVLLAIIGEFPKGAELLLLAFVRTLTESGNPGQASSLFLSCSRARALSLARARSLSLYLAPAFPLSRTLAECGTQGRHMADRLAGWVAASEAESEARDGERAANLLSEGAQACTRECAI